MRKIEFTANDFLCPLDEAFNKCISAGRAYLLLRKDHQDHLKMAAEECGFKYLRFHGIYQDDMGVYREDKHGRSIYSWQYVDAVYDFILSIGMRPFVVFDFMPSKLASGSQTVYWEKANISPPNDYVKWSELIEKTVRHFAERYGQNEVSKWYFEVWNEPDNEYFFTKDIDEYLKLYEVTAKAVKKAGENYLVGGPAIAGKKGWVAAIIDHCCKNKVPLDFITAHTYSTKPFKNSSEKEETDKKENSIPVWEPGTQWQMGNQSYDPNGVENSIYQTIAEVAESNRKDMDIYYTEWGLTWDYWDPLRDSYHAASYILSRLKQTFGKVKAMSYCEVSDVFEEDGPPTENFHGGFGLINLQGIRKPAYFAYKYLNMLKGIMLECSDGNAVVCVDNSTIQLLFWDCASRQNDENKFYYNKDNPPKEAETVGVFVSGMNAGEYELTARKTGYKHNDPYTAYLETEFKDSMSPAQIDILNEMTSDDPIDIKTISVNDDGELSYETKMNENDVYIITIKRTN